MSVPLYIEKMNYFKLFKEKYSNLLSCLTLTAGGWEGCFLDLDISKEDIMKELNLTEEDYSILVAKVDDYIENIYVKDLIGEERNWKKYAWILERRFKEHWSEDNTKDTKNKNKENKIIVLTNAKDKEEDNNEEEDS